MPPPEKEALNPLVLLADEHAKVDAAIAPCKAAGSISRPDPVEPKPSSWRKC
ncbi:MAG: hypothetical protein QHH07_08130 [Sedimentisphaerales bacterium]|nr:hypothetical protein [Sedimentisphaerales bacterium]